MKKSLHLIYCIAALFIVDSAAAEEVRMYASPPTAEEMSRALFSEPAGIKMRSIKFGSKKAKSAETERSGIGLPIQFGPDSANILSESHPYLDQIGIMLKMEKLADIKLLIEGHTDGSGSAGHNKRLSKKRAQSVKNYLISKHDVTSERLLISGKGESRPLRGKDPMDPINRRVEFYPVNSSPHVINRF